jgi:hypothetical protein
MLARSDLLECAHEVGMSKMLACMFMHGALRTTRKGTRPGAAAPASGGISAERERKVAERCRKRRRSDGC